MNEPPGSTTVEAQIKKPEPATMIQDKPEEAKNCAFPGAESFPSGSLFYYRVSSNFELQQKKIRKKNFKKFLKNFQ